MSLPDSGEIDNALIDVLNADAELRALAPDGVYFGAAPPGRENFVIVSLVEGLTLAQMGPATERRAAENCQYIVKAVLLNGADGDARKAGARIDALLEDQTIPIDGYTCLSIVRTDRIRDSEPDAVEPSTVWKHRGGYYRITAAPGGTP
jgi:hypothetical protein